MRCSFEIVDKELIESVNTYLKINNLTKRAFIEGVVKIFFLNKKEYLKTLDKEDLINKIIFEQKDEIKWN